MFSSIYPKALSAFSAPKTVNPSALSNVLRARRSAKPAYRPLPEIVTMPSRPLPQIPPPLPADTLRYASRRWHAEAWEREREREMSAIENPPDIAARRRTSA